MGAWFLVGMTIFFGTYTSCNLTPSRRAKASIGKRFPPDLDGGPDPDPEGDPGGLACKGWDDAR